MRFRVISQMAWEHVMLQRGGHGITREAYPTPERRFEVARRLTSKNQIKFKIFVAMCGSVKVTPNLKI